MHSSSFFSKISNKKITVRLMGWEIQYFGMKLYMFRTVLLSIIRGSFTVRSAMVYVIQVCRQLSSRTLGPARKLIYKPVWHTPLQSIQWINSWSWTDELSETCRVSCQNKFVKLVHLVGFIIKKWLPLFMSVMVWSVVYVSDQSACFPVFPSDASSL